MGKSIIDYSHQNEGEDAIPTNHIALNEQNIQIQYRRINEESSLMLSHIIHWTPQSICA